MFERTGQRMVAINRITFRSEVIVRVAVQILIVSRGKVNPIPCFYIEKRLNTVL